MLIKEPVARDPLLEAIYQHIEEEGMKEQPRGYVGASSVGDDCELKIWMALRYPQHKKKKHAELIMAANDGHRGELLMAEYIREVHPDIELLTRDSEGKQFGYYDLDGKYQGHCDGLILGIPQAPKTRHVWEHKVKNEKFFDAIAKWKDKVDEKQVLYNWDYLYYCQAVTYMQYFDVTRHYMTVAQAGTRKFTSIRTAENKALAKHLRDKADRINRYPSAPVGISKHPSFWKCKMCDFSNTCPSINPGAIL